MKHYLSISPTQSVGRPPVIALSADDIEEIQSYYLPSNLTKKSGSIRLAWVRFCESRPALHHLVKDHMPETTIPTAVVEACRRAKALVAARGGAPRIRHEAAYVPGTMRRHHIQRRRLMAGERASVDDATRNTACYIPWPWGGCPTSDKYGVKIGRWQTLVVHDDATGFVPFVQSVFRLQQSYRATDAASCIYQAERQICQWEQWAIEGGVWQAKRTLAVLGGRFISAKGRPNQKLVENYFGRLWTIMAGQPGDVGRHRGEMKIASELYLKARAGQVDPRKHFLSLDQAQSALYTSIQYLNEKRIDSRTYGSWVPQSRWESDMEELMLKPRATDDDFLILPVSKTHTVRNATVRTTEDGPHGVPMIWSFSAEWLWQYEGRKVDLYFDPLAEWPVKATITLEAQRKPIGTIECISPIADSKDRAVEITKAIRQIMMSESRVLMTKHTQRTVRTDSGVMTLVNDPSNQAAAASTDLIDHPQIIPCRGGSTHLGRLDREAIAATLRVTREDLADSLSRRAARFEDAEV